MQGTRKCKVCGKEYPYCKTNRPVGISRWQDIACSLEHAAIYFSQIESSRTGENVASEQCEAESVESYDTEIALEDDFDEEIDEEADDELEDDYCDDADEIDIET